jgi:hypothetical protein
VRRLPNRRSARGDDRVVPSYLLKREGRDLVTWIESLLEEDVGAVCQ